MNTLFSHRLLILIPAARQAAINTFWANQIDTDGAGDQTFTIGLSPTGTPPVTHYWASCALRPIDLARIVTRLCTLAGIADPNLGGLTRQQILTWLQNNLPTIRTNTGIAAVRDDNDAAWSDPDTLLQQIGLQRITPVAP